MRLGRVACIPDSVEGLAEFRHRLVGGQGLVNLLVLCPGPDQIQANPLQPPLLKLQHFGGAVGQVNNPTGNDWSTVVYLDHNSPAVSQVRDLNVASQGKGRVGG